MVASVTAVNLFPDEIEYFRKANFLAPHLVAALEAAECEGDTRFVLKISRDRAEEFRSAMTERLAKVGFDDNYEPTSEGSLLEELIDRFYVA